MAAVKTWGDYALDLKDTDIYNELTTDAFTLYNGDKVASIGYCYESYSIIVNKTLLDKAGYSVEDITNFDSLKKVADDIHARSAELGFDAEGEFKQGKAVFFQNGSWEYGALSEVYSNDEMCMIPIYCGVEGEEEAGLCSGTENCRAVNAKASEADQKATLDFMKWVVTSEAGTKCMAEQMGSIPYKGAAEVDNIFLQNANDMLAAGKYNVDWTFNYTPNVNDWRATLVAAMNKYDNGGSWDDVVTAFVKGWENQYNVANAN